MGEVQIIIALRMAQETGRKLFGRGILKKLVLTLNPSG